MKTVKVYCGISIQDKCSKELHPVEYVKLSEKIILSDKDEICYSNSPDFIAGIREYGLKYKVNTEFYLDGTYCDNIDEIFGNFNKSLDILYNIDSE
jgi:hypothetical protein